MSVANVNSLLKRAEFAVEQPRLYVFQFFEDLRNQIDIGCQVALDESNQELMLKQQAKLIEKVQRVESYCLERTAEAVKEDRDGEMHLILGQIEADLRKEDISVGELERMERVLSDKILQIENALFQSRTMIFVKAITNKKYEDERWVIEPNLIDLLQLVNLIILIDYLINWFLKKNVILIEGNQLHFKFSRIIIEILIRFQLNFNSIQ